MDNNTDKDYEKMLINEILNESTEAEYSDKHVIYDPKVIYKFGKGRETLFVETNLSGEKKTKYKQHTSHSPVNKNNNIIVTYYLDQDGNKTGSIKFLKFYDFMELDLSIEDENHLDKLNLVWELQPSGIAIKTSKFLDKIRGVIRYKTFKLEVMDYFDDFLTIRNHLEEHSTFFGKRFFSLPYDLGNNMKYAIRKISKIFDEYWGNRDDTDLIDWDFDSFMEFDVHLKEDKSSCRYG